MGMTVGAILGILASGLIIQLIRQRILLSHQEISIKYQDRMIKAAEVTIGIWRDAYNGLREKSQHTA